MFKSITGQDIIEAQHKYGHPFTFTPWAVPIFSANETWRSGDTTDGYFRRWITLPFPRKVASLGGHLDESKLYLETPGILAKAIGHLRTLMARGEFELIGAAADLKRDFERESDIVSTWLHSDAEHTTSEAGNTNLRTKKTHLYKMFTHWCQESGHTQPVNLENWTKRLERLGYPIRTLDGYATVYGIKSDLIPMGSILDPSFSSAGLGKD